MKAIITKAFAIYSTDDSGYSRADPIALYPFKAAAEASEEKKSLKGYSHITEEHVLKFEDVNYLLDKVVSKDRIVGSAPLGQPIVAYMDYIYNDLCDRSRYIIGDNNLLEYIKTHKKINAQSKYMTRDEDDYFLLKSDKNFTIKTFKMSRELAIQNALDKLTEEERKLLGI